MGRQQVYLLIGLGVMVFLFEAAVLSLAFRHFFQ